MANILYDSLWIPQASGAILAAVDCGQCAAIRMTGMASGSGGSLMAASWIAGADTPVPWQKNQPAYPAVPKATGAYTLGAPAGANTQKTWVIGPSMAYTGSLVLDFFVPSWLYVSMSVSASSWGRLIVEGM